MFPVMTAEVYRYGSTESGSQRVISTGRRARDSHHELPAICDLLMPRLVLAGLSSQVKTGPQGYEEARAQRAQRVLGGSWRASRTSVRMLRSPLADTARVPAAILSGGRPKIRKGIGRGSTAGATSCTASTFVGDLPPRKW